MTTKYTVGQEVAVARHGSWNTNYHFGYFVHKVTPSGQVTVRQPRDVSSIYPEGFYERRFDKDSYEMGTTCSKYNRDRLMSNVAELREGEAKKQRAATAAALITKLGDECKSTYSKEHMLEAIAKIEATLAAAKLAVEAV
jgi:hypothetical protein